MGTEIMTLFRCDRCGFVETVQDVNDADTEIAVFGWKRIKPDGLAREYLLLCPECYKVWARLLYNFRTSKEEALSEAS